MRITYFGIAGLATLAALVGTPVQAVVVFEHVGKTDPLTEGFVVAGAPTSAGGTESGIDYWEVTSPAAAAGGYNHPPSNADLSTNGGWRTTWRVKVIDAMRPMEAQMDVQDPLNEFQFGLVKTLGPYGLEMGAYYRAHPAFDWIKLSSVDPSSDYMTWQMQLNAKGNFDPSDDEVSYYLNGSLLGTAPRSELIPSGGGNNALFGDFNGSVSGTTRTNLFRFENFQVPEPGSASLALMSVLAATVSARRIKRTGNR